MIIRARYLAGSDRLLLQVAVLAEGALGRSGLPDLDIIALMIMLLSLSMIIVIMIIIIISRAKNEF